MIDIKGYLKDFLPDLGFDSDPVGILGISVESEAILDRYRGISEGFLARFGIGSDPVGIFGMLWRTWTSQLTENP